MEREKIGTKATRSNIVDTLYRRRYIRGQHISVTTLGEIIIETLLRYSPEIIQVKMTRNLEEQLMKIEVGEKNSENVINSIINELKPILNQFKENEEKIGKSIRRNSHQLRKKI